MPFEPAPQQVKAPTAVELGRKALADLAAYLPTIPSKRWHFESWLLESASGRIVRGKAMCGTVGCAIGHGINHVPSVRALLEWSDNRKPTGLRGEAPWKAFGMTSEAWRDLFTMDGYGGDDFGRVPTPHQVARNIEEYLARTA